MNCSRRRRERARHQLKKRRGKEDEDQNIPVGNVMEVDTAGSRRATYTRKGMQKLIIVKVCFTAHEML